jgi:hypothetical protein
MPENPDEPSTKSGLLDKARHDEQCQQLSFGRSQLNLVANQVKEVDTPRLRDLTCAAILPRLTLVETKNLNRIRFLAADLDHRLKNMTRIVNELTAHARFRKHDRDTQRSFVQMDPETGLPRMPQQTFEYMCYLEGQALQRIRANLPRGYATDRNWRRVLHTKIKRRLYEFRVHYEVMKRQGETIPCGAVIIQPSMDAADATQDILPDAGSLLFKPDKGRASRRKEEFKQRKRFRRKLNKRAKRVGTHSAQAQDATEEPAASDVEDETYNTVDAMLSMF